MNPEIDIQWTDARALDLRGLGWPASRCHGPYDRLPREAEGNVTDTVWFLSRQSAGVHVDFVTDAKEIFGRWTVEGDNGRTDREAMCSWSGLDLYGQADDGRWWWVGAHTIDDYPRGCGKLHWNLLDGRRRRYRAYAPLRNRLVQLEIGRHDIAVEPAPRDKRPPVVYYGTSIVHGAGVGRPGMSHASQLGRLLDREIVNLGVCGNARMEPAIADLLIELDPVCYLLDCLPNMSPELVDERMTNFIVALRQAKPSVPIILVNDRNHGDGAFVTGRVELKAEKDAAQTAAIDRARQAGVDHLHLLEHETWFGDHNEGTCDGSHPNDLGAWIMAQQLAPMVRAIIG